ncbi:MAG: SEC-C metal-binding domain-containing protein [Syntrophomonadaceae bacterium]|jgi:hypothetical protein
MSNKKVGRNDPCPCGSGKKYKNCCMQLDELTGGALDPFSRYSQVISSLKIKMDNQFASSLRKNKKDNKDRFTRFAVGNQLPPDNEALLSDWLWFDYRDKDNKTLGMRYFEENGQYLGQIWQDCLDALNKSYLSIYEPVDSNLNYLLVQDIFTQEKRHLLLQEPWVIDESTGNILLLGRLVNLPQATIFTGMVLMLKNISREKDFLINNLKYFQQITGCSNIVEFLKNNTDIIYGLFDHAYKKTRLSLNDIRYSKIEKADQTAILAAISKCEQFNHLYSCGGFEWYRPKIYSGYARLALSEDTIIICVDIIDDWEVLYTTAEKLLPGIELQVVSNLIEPPAISNRDLWFLIMKDQETARWFGTPHRELDDKTPKKVLEEEGGRQRLISMLDTFAAKTARSDEERELIAYMREYIEYVYTHLVH